MKKLFQGLVIKLHAHCCAKVFVRSFHAGFDTDFLSQLQSSEDIK